jgi:hypothetical protein
MTTTPLPARDLTKITVITQHILLYLAQDMRSDFTMDGTDSLYAYT